VDPETGARVTRYIHQTGNDMVFYYSSPSITADGKKLVFWSSVSGRNEIHSINIADNEPFSVQLTQGATTSSDNPCLDSSRNWVFYYVGRRLMRTNVDTLESDWLFEIPENTRYLALSSNGKYVAFSYIESMNRPRPRVWGLRMAYPQLYMRPLSVIAAVDLDTLEGSYVWGDHAFLAHVQLAPFDKELVHFGDQSATNRQSEAYVLPVNFHEDKQPFQLFQNNKQRLIYVGHTFFTQDGWLAGQMMEYTGITDRWNSYTDTVGFNTIVRPDGTNMRRARFPGEAKPMHVHAAHADSWWVGDTTPLPRSKASDMGLMCLIKNHWESQEMDVYPLYRHNHDHIRPFHMHPWINNAEDKIVFACKYQGRNAMHILDLKTFLADKGLTGKQAQQNARTPTTAPIFNGNESDK